MGGHPYWYLVPYRDDAQAALDELREREFRAGRYNPVLPFIDYSEDALFSQKPGPEHASIEEAVEAAEQDGTRSILDIRTIAEMPEYGAAAPMDRAELQLLLGTDKPTREMLLASHELFAGIERG